MDDLPQARKEAESRIDQVDGGQAYLAGQQALKERLPLVAGAVHQVAQGVRRLVREGLQVLREVALHHACSAKTYIPYVGR